MAGPLYIVLQDGIGTIFFEKIFDFFTPVNWLFSSQVAALLLSHGADVNAKTNGGTTPIQLAVSEKNYNAVVEGKIFYYFTIILKYEERHLKKSFEF